MLTNIFLNDAPLVTSLFFIMGAFIIFQILFAGIRLILKVRERSVDRYVLRSILGIIYILAILFAMQLAIRGGSTILDLYQLPISFHNFLYPYIKCSFQISSIYPNCVGFHVFQFCFHQLGVMVYVSCSSIVLLFIELHQRQY